MIGKLYSILNTNNMACCMVSKGYHQNILLHLSKNIHLQSLVYLRCRCIKCNM